MGEKHTRGPWIEEVDTDYPDQPSGWIVGVVEYAGCGSHEAKWTSEANKRLALAAPDLLEAADHIDRTATDIADDMVVISGSAYRLMRAAIAKATGDSDAQ